MARIETDKIKKKEAFLYIFSMIKVPYLREIYLLTTYLLTLLIVKLFILTSGVPSGIRIDSQALNLAGTTGTTPVLDPLAVLCLDNRL